MSHVRVENIKYFGVKNSRHKEKRLRNQKSISCALICIHHQWWIFKGTHGSHDTP